MIKTTCGKKNKKKRKQNKKKNQTQKKKRQNVKKLKEKTEAAVGLVAVESFGYLHGWCTTLKFLCINFPQRQFNPHRGVHCGGEHSQLKLKLIFFFAQLPPTQRRLRQHYSCFISLSLSVVLRSSCLLLLSWDGQEGVEGGGLGFGWG